MLDNQVFKTIVKFEDRWFIVETRNHLSSTALWASAEDPTEISETVVFEGNSNDNRERLIGKLSAMDGSMKAHVKVIESLGKFGRF